MSLDVDPSRLAVELRPVSDEPDGPTLRTVLGAFATGVTVVTATTGHSGPPCGMTANAFTSVSLDPPLVLVCLKRDAVVHAAIGAAGSFAISVLSSGQESIARYFADRSRPRGHQEFSGVCTEPGRHTGAPMLAGAVAWLECQLACVYDGGDHAIVVGKVQAAHLGQHADALLFYRGAFHRLVPSVV